MRATRWRIILLAVPVIAAGAGGLAGCAKMGGVPHAGTDRSPLSWGPDLTAAQLPGVLLDAPQVNQIMGTTAMAMFKNYTKMPGDEGSYSDTACVGAVFNTVDAGYRGSGYVAASGSELSDTGAKHYVDEGVVSFGSGADAQKFLANSQDLWRRCVGKHVTYTPKTDSATTWAIRAPVTSGGITTAVVDEEAGEGYACVHGITAKANVVIDISACSYGIADHGAGIANSIVNAIAGKFPT
jgi:hypothetical protein